MKRLLSALMALLLICAPVFGALAEEEVIESAMVEEAVPETEAALPAEEAEAEPRAVSATTGDDIPLDAAHFPDKAFRKDLARFDTNGDGALSPKEIKAVKYQTYDGSIKNFTGIGYLSYLTELRIEHSSIKALDVSGNTRLTELYISGGKFKTLDLSANTKLEKVTMYGNERLKTLTFGRNTRLTSLTCNGNGLTKLEIGGLSRLEYLDCKNNKLPKLDVSGLKNLKTLNCLNNKLTKLDVSKNAKLEFLNCWDNKLTKLDVSMLGALKSLGCGGNSIHELDLSKNKKLEKLYCSRNNMTSLKLASDALHLMDCKQNSIKAIDVAKCPRFIRTVREIIPETWYDSDTVVCWQCAPSEEAADWEGYNYFFIDKVTRLLNGKEVLYSNKKPKSIRFSKSSITVKKDKLFTLPPLIVEPEGAAVTDTNIDFDRDWIYANFRREENFGDIPVYYATRKGTYTITATTRNGKTAKLKIVVK